ncbi:thiamine-binding protein [Evansella sp. AB-P1]|uniref:thiamine-binding protein n=1 Tax=Evansella sp. AB-P1 TaxID=3037653 RepID=UPI00241D6012|nr:thiamine-binding protein [Evansella sp. AB-P1]MDG5787481.1 thiamine-binding protein [Evansella sp. AB-P1]
MTTVMAGLQVLPNGKDMNTDGVLPGLVKTIKESGLNYEIGPMETVVEGNMEEVMELIIQLQGEAMNEEGTEEVLTNIKLHYRPKGIGIKDKH